ncbi:MAG: oligosaccharide flippase family protein [Phycisphaerales bacterium]
MVGRAFARGISIYAVAAVVSRLVSFAAQIVLGRLLSDREFGIFAAAFGVVAVTGCLRSGGVQHYLQALPSERFDRDAGPYVWLATIAAAVGGVATLMAAVAVGWFDRPPAMRLVLVVLAGWVFLNAISLIYRARMQSEMRVLSLAVTEVVGMLLRSVLGIVLALFGAGAMAIALPMTITSLFETVVFGSQARMRREHWRATRAELRAAWHTVRWTLLFAVCAVVVFQGDYFAASFFLSDESLGNYYFAFSLCNQPTYVVVGTFTAFIAPVVSRLGDSRDRQASAVLRLARAMGVLVPVIAFVVPALLPELDHLVWAGKWHVVNATAVPLTLAICLMSSTALLYGATNGIGAFRLAAIIETARAVAVFVGAGLGAWWFGSPFGVASMLCIVAGGISVIGSSVILRLFGANPWRAALSVLVGPCVVAVAVGGLRLGLNRVSGWSGADDEHRWRYAIELVAAGVAYTAVVVLVARVCFRTTVREAIALLPDRVSRLAQYLVGR